MDSEVGGHWRVDTSCSQVFHVQHHMDATHDVRSCRRDHIKFIVGFHQIFFVVSAKTMWESL